MIGFLVRCFHFLVLLLFFLWDLIVSSVQVAVTVLTPGDISNPRLATVPLRVQSDWGITLVANFISLTPGTLSVDVSEDRKTLLVHSLLAGGSSEELRADVRRGIEERVLKVTQR
ncbi:Na+/H+ antiporter subunit E [Amaricoccus macauensis]|uniref:Na+/H+ antiporter subunit E n=1 Tax=Amaricoccus macauensis TaxID=57001 RepID=UPI003C7AAD33